MFNKVREFFRGDIKGSEISSTEGVTERDIQIAVAVFLIDAACADGEVAPEEIQSIRTIMQDAFSTDQDTIIELLEIADSVRDHIDRVDEFVGIVGTTLNTAQKQHVLTLVWNVILADGQIEVSESRYAVRIAHRLKLSEQQAEGARVMALRGKL